MKYKTRGEREGKGFSLHSRPEGEEFFEALANPAMVEERMMEEENVTLVAGGERIAERRPANLMERESEEEGEDDEDESEDEIDGPTTFASDSEDDGDEFEGEEEEEHIRSIQKEIEGDDGEESDEDHDGLNWKDGMRERASQAFYDRQSSSTNLRNLGIASTNQKKFVGHSIILYQPDA